MLSLLEALQGHVQFCRAVPVRCSGLPQVQQGVLVIPIHNQ